MKPSVKSALAIPKQDRAGTVPLSFGQERLWFLNQMDPHSPVYNMPLYLRLEGSLDVQVLQQVLNEIVRRHESLRTTFVSRDGVPEQRVSETAEFEVPVISLDGTTSDEREEKARAICAQEFETPFDLEQGPLFRARIVRLDTDDHILVTVRHHIVSDGWSNGKLLHEIASLYMAFSEGKPSPLEELPVQYADFAIWQREQLQGDKLERQVRFWKEYLADAPFTLDLQTDRPRPPVQTTNGGRIALELPDMLIAGLQAVAQKEKTTLFVALFAAYAVLLSKYSNQEEIIIGTPVSGRSRKETEPMIGLFINTLPIRFDLSGNPSFIELLARVRKSFLDAFAHQEIPFEMIVNRLNVTRDMSRTPLFQTLFAFQNTPKASFDLPGISIKPVSFERITSKFDLTLGLNKSGSRIKGALEFNSDLFDATTVERMVGHFRTLLQGIAENPECQVADLTLMDGAEKQLVLKQWNDTETDYPRDTCVHQLFEIQAEKTPDAVAVVCNDQEYTYRQLNIRANRLAHHLRGLGVQRGTFVGIALERSTDLIVGLLAILKAGGAYVPLDSDYPQDRLAFMLKDTAASVLLTTAAQQDKYSGQQCKIVRVDADEAEISSGNPENPGNASQADDCVYVIYTSGSTGRPKGTVIPHRGVVRLVCNTNYAEFGADQALLHMASISFDASTFEVWGALLHGGRCVLCPDRVPTPEQIGEMIINHGVTTAWLTSALFNLVIDEKPDALMALKQLLIGGEALSLSHVRKAEKLLTGTRIINGYGPTENTTFTCCYPISGNLNDNMLSVPIGRPISNTRVYILDRFGNPCPVSVPGELYIAGDGLAAGYLNNPELTAEKFVPDPFSEDGNDRLYRTGDLVRYLPDGNIQFIGRIDTQVKIRGFRIEPGEIESSLRSNQKVREAAVIVREDIPGSKQLVAYFVPEDRGEPGVEELRSFLSATLPDYMLPAAYIRLESIPLTSNGKVNRKALPAPGKENYQEGYEFVAPRNDLERTLAAIWKDLLGVDPIGIRDDFFSLGGNSLLAARLAARIRNELGFTLPLASLFKASTIEKLAQYIEAEPEGDADSCLIPIQREGTKTPLFLIHGAGGNVIGFRDLSVHLGNDQPVFGLESPGLDGKREPLSSIEEMADHYIREIRKVQAHGPYLLGGVCVGGSIAYEMAQRLDHAGERVALVALFDSRNPPRMMTANVKGQVHRSRSLWQKIYLRWKEGSLFNALYQRLGASRTRWARKTIRPLIRYLFKPERRYFKKIWSVNERALADYVPSPYSGRMVSFLAGEQREWTNRDPRLGWGKLSLGGLEVIKVPGRHDNFLRSPHVEVLAEKLVNCIERALSSKT